MTLKGKVIPTGLKHNAASIARNYGDKGAIVITVGDEGIRIGVHGLSDRDIQDALCVAIHYNFCMMESSPCNGGQPA